jgi:hypothetical protein
MSGCCCWRGRRYVHRVALLALCFSIGMTFQFLVREHAHDRSSGSAPTLCSESLRCLSNGWFESNPVHTHRDAYYGTTGGPCSQVRNRLLLRGLAREGFVAHVVPSLGAAFMYVLAPMPYLLFGSPQGSGDGYSLLGGGDSGDGCVCFASPCPLTRALGPRCKEPAECWRTVF